MTTPIMWAPGMTLEALERQVIQRAFAHFEKNKTATASALGISIRGLEMKLKKYTEDKTVMVSRQVEASDKSRDFLLRCRGQHPDQLNPQPPPVAPVAAAK